MIPSSAVSIVHLFFGFTADGNGVVSSAEFYIAAKTDKWVTPHVNGMFHVLDSDGDGVITFLEILQVSLCIYMGSCYYCSIVATLLSTLLAS